MISVEEALNRILARIPILGLEKVDIIGSLRRVIGEDILSPRDIPSLDNSAMDGYAVRAADIKGALRESPIFLNVIDELPAGALPQRSVAKGEAVRIMTGAPIPKGADTVVMVEDTEKAGKGVRVFQGVSTGENIRRAGEDVKKGERVISRGSVIRAAEVGMLASVGKAFYMCTKDP